MFFLKMDGYPELHKDAFVLHKWYIVRHYAEKREEFKRRRIERLKGKKKKK